MSAARRENFLGAEQIVQGDNPGGLSPASRTAKPPGASISSRATSLIVKLRRQVATFSRTGGRFSAIARAASSRANSPINFSFSTTGNV